MLSISVIIIHMRNLQPKNWMITLEKFDPISKAFWPLWLQGHNTTITWHEKFPLSSYSRFCIYHSMVPTGLNHLNFPFLLTLALFLLHLNPQSLLLKYSLHPLFSNVSALQSTIPHFLTLHFCLLTSHNFPAFLIEYPCLHPRKYISLRT